jgi:hypothetical protein
LSVVESLAKQWAADDPVAVAGWLNRMPSGESRDAAIAAMLPSLVTEDPVAAFGQAQGIGGDETKVAGMQSVVTAWADSAPDTAIEAVQAADLPEAIKSSLISVVQSSRKENDQ